MKARIFSLSIFLITLIAFSCNPKKSETAFPFLDTNLSLDERVNDLVGRMTLEEKIGQMMNAAPAIDRLGVPEYNWWNECLHGVARAGLATVFPQAIGLGAMWDEPAMFQIATAISDEARAKHHEFVRKNTRLIYQGLTMWSPNINIFRDPRWGRGQETYGEDPYLTGRMAVQFIKGLQGNDPKYYKTIATVKHFAVHSGPEPDRHAFDAIIGERDFRETYLPQFEMGIKEGKAYSVMCAYNRLNGEACCGSDHLLNKILREEWGFDGYVVSDCGAINDIYKGHNIKPTAAEASALAVQSGCDLECATAYQSLKEAVANKNITEAEIDVAVRRLFLARFKLGMFDPSDQVAFAQIPYSVVDSKENKDLALMAARKSIVLLKNTPATGKKENILPLSKEIKTLAVIGPNADQWRTLLGNYNGLPSNPVTPLRGIKEKLAGGKVLFAEGSELAIGLPTFDLVPAEVLSHQGDAGLAVEYFNNKELTGNPLFTHVDQTIDIKWYDDAPRKDMDGDNFGARWTGEFMPDLSGKYQLGIITTCKTKFYLNDSLIADTKYHFRDEYGDPRLRKSGFLNFTKGKKYQLKIEIGESYGDAQIQLVWSKPRTDQKEALKKSAVAIAKQADAVVLCVGLSARLEGEEMDVNIDGFKGGDRTTLDLPVIQQELIKAIQATGKPIVLILLNGSAISVNWEDKNIPAIVETWYGGQAAGQALADVLFGDYNPGGKLPVTFYKSVDDLPSFGDYNMKGHTYRYYEGEVLYPFGFGLSYTTFSFENLKIASDIKAGDSLKVSVDVTNTGKVSGEEVVQVYLSNLEASVPVPLKALKGFKRIGLDSGEKKTVQFSIAPDAFSVISEDNRKVINPGKFNIAVGSGQPDAKGSVVVKGSLNVLK